MKKKVNIILQGKGGVGKSFASSCAAQFYRDAGSPLVAIDADPVNSTLAALKELNAETFDLLEENTINARNFDAMIEKILTEDSNFVIDAGAATFLPLSNYLVENPVLDMIEEANKDVVIHTIVTGGQAFLDTAFGFRDLASAMPQSVGFVVWLNEFFGPVANEDGKLFEDTPGYKEHAARITGTVRLQKRRATTWEQDVAEMTKRKLTFGEAIKSPHFSLVAKQRLTTIRKDIYDQLRPILDHGA